MSTEKTTQHEHALPAQLSKAMPRRKFVKTYGTAVAGLTVGLTGCTGGEVTSSSAASSSLGASSSAASSSSLAASSSSVASSSEAASSSAPVVEGWARGGTQSMWANFPPAAPFGSATPTVCQQATGDQILGPCFFRDRDYLRQDISEGEVGLPMVFGFKVMDRNCTPMPGVIVELWHTNCEGLYSDDRSNSVEQSPNYWDGSFFGLSCADNNARAMTKSWHRGGQITDGDGVVYFKSCFPYWYAGRTTHVHLRFIRESSGQELLTTQFGFADALCNDIHLNHPEYSHVDENGGQRQDTTMGGDPEFGGTGGGQWTMETQRQQDGSLLAYKNIIIA